MYKNNKKGCIKVHSGFQMLRRNAEDRCNAFLRTADKFPADCIFHSFHHENFKFIHKFPSLCILQNGDDANIMTKMYFVQTDVINELHGCLSSASRYGLPWPYVLEHQDSIGGCPMGMGGKQSRHTASFIYEYRFTVVLLNKSY